jgi:HlyD family secretion protein
MKKIIFISMITMGLFSACGKQMEETKPIRKDVTETVFASGTLEANATYSLTALSDGYLVDVSFKENDIVKQGQIVATIDNKQNLLNNESATALYDIAQQNTSSNAPLIAQAKIAAATAKQKMDFDLEKTERYKKLADANSIAKIDYENTVLQYQTSKGNYENTLEIYNQQMQQANQQVVINKAQKKVNTVVSGFNQIKAVYSGKVYKKFKQKGDFVRQGDVIATIGDANFIYAKVSLDESSIAKVKVGQEAIIQLNINKNKNYKGRFAEIMPTFNEETQSFTCKIYFIDTLDFNIINTQLQVNIITGVHKNALLIPRKYLGFGNLVTIKGSEKPIKVATKFVSSEWVQVESGIDENTILITDKK